MPRSCLGLEPPGGRGDDRKVEDSIVVSRVTQGEESSLAASFLQRRYMLLLIHIQGDQWAWPAGHAWP